MQSDDLYARADWLARQLRDAGIPAAAERIARLLHGIAWTTSSELIGELGKVLLAIRREYQAALPAEIARQLDAAITSARTVWPDLTECDESSSCSSCAEARTRIEIRHPSDLRSVLLSIHALVEGGVLRVLPRANTLSGEEPFESLRPEGPWPDVLSYRFQCVKCGMHFGLSAETYHGQGGEWKVQL